MNYYKRINRNENIFENAPIALQKSYEALKANNKVIVANDDCGEFLLVPTEMIDEFILTAVSRADLKSRGFDADNLSDEDMQDIADNMADDYIEYGGYWEGLEDEAEKMGARKVHRILDTSFGEVMLQPKTDNGEEFLEVYQGDNFDEYVGEISASIDDDEDDLLELIDDLLYNSQLEDNLLN